MSNWGRKHPESIESRDTPPLTVFIELVVAVPVSVLKAVSVVLVLLAVVFVVTST